MPDGAIRDFVNRKIAGGAWREEILPPEVTGMTRLIKILHARRTANLIAFENYGDNNTVCPHLWADLAIGAGPCGYLCRACFLMLTHRAMKDPFRHLLYENVEDFERAAARWLLAPDRRPQNTLGVGIDRSDSLLYEKVTGHVHRLAPLFSHAETNPSSG